MKAAIVRWFSALMAAKAASRPMWLGEPEPRLVVLCAWCADSNDPRHAEASHTICDACIEKFEAGAAA